MAPGAQGLGALEIATEPIPGFTRYETSETDASKCVVSGQGLHEATVRQATYFWIQAYDTDGNKKTTGGDIFFCAIRGPATVRARVLDNADGTYLVVWKPSTSGLYAITISLFGISLPGVPFTAHASTNQPCHTKCEVRGNALYEAISRSTHSFDIYFRDRLGQVAHAVDLDVFVEQVPPNSPRTRAGAGPTGATTKEDQEKLKAKRAAEAKMDDELTAIPGHKAARTKKSKRSASPVPAAAAVEAPAPLENAVFSPAPAESAGEGGLTSRKRTMRVRIEKTLVVRSEPLRDAPELGRLFPGQVVTVLEERMVSELEVWGCVALDSIGQALDNVLKHAASDHDLVVPPTPPAPLPPPKAPLRATAAAGPPVPMSSPAAPSPPSSQSPPPPARASPSATPSAPPAAAVAAPAAAPLVTAPAAASVAGAPTVAAATPSGATPSGATPSGATPSGAPPASAPLAAPAAPAPPPPPASPPSPSAQSSSRPREPVRESAVQGWVAGTHSWRPGYFSPAPSAARNAAEEAKARQQQQQQRLWDAGQTAWVLLMTHGKKLVTSRVKLGPDSRRQYLRQWMRRRENDKTEKRLADRLSSANLNLELASDPAGIGFGFGGVEPGTLHARGQLYEKHSVFYSIGLAGDYLLHVRLRHAAAAVPGSPFSLRVLPAPAHAKATRLPVSSVSGRVGLEGEGSEGGIDESEIGARLTLRTADKMGNYCTSGGADVKLVCTPEGPVTKVHDNKDGTYLLEWRSKASGTFKSRVTIGTEDVLGSPMEFTLSSSDPDLSKSELSGDGLRACIAGQESEITIKFVDQYGNTAIPGGKFAFGMAFSKNDKEGVNAAKQSLAAAEPTAHQGAWEPGDTGVYKMRYFATEAGPCRLHVWCDPQSKGERLPFPNSPFQLSVSSGEPSTTVSQVDGSP